MKRAALLLRCSTDSQDYERQLLDLKSITEAMGYTVEEKSIFGQYITGKDDVRKKDRESIANLKAACESNQVDAIFINEVSRLSRDSVAGRLFIREFNFEFKTPIYFRDLGHWTINPDTHIVDSNFQTMLGFHFDMAEAELKSMKTRLASGKRKNAREGKTIGGATPYGYSKDTTGKLVINEEEAQVVRLIFSKYLEKHNSITTVCRYLISKGYKENSRVNFGTGLVQSILRERKYIGEQRYNLVNPDEPDKGKQKEVFVYHIDAIIDEDTFKKAQLKLDSNRTGDNKKINTERRVHLLSKLIKCPLCQQSYTTKACSSNLKAGTVKNWNYSCASRYNFITCSSNIALNANNIERVIWNLTKQEMIAIQELSREERVKKIDKEKADIVSFNEELGTISSSISKLELQKKKLLTLLLETDMNEDDRKLFNEKNDSINAQINSYKSRVDYLNRSIALAESNIARYSETSFTESILNKFESDKNKMKELIRDNIRTITPYRISNSQIIMEVETKHGSYTILFEPRNSQKRCWYIDRALATWQNSEFSHKTYIRGNFFYIPMASLIIETDSVDTIVSFNEMKEICSKNGFEIEYN